MSEEYDLKKSEDTVGQLRPIIVDARGRIVDGLHREASNPDWQREVREEIKTDEDYWKARAHLNYSRRNAQEARGEKLKIINSLAKYYMKQGLQVSSGKLVGHQGGGHQQNEVLDAVINALSGALKPDYIRQNIDSTYTQDQKRRQKSEDKGYVGEPEDAIRGQFGKQRREKANKVIEDLKEKAVEEAKQNPEFRAKIVKEEREKVVATIKKEYPSNKPKVYGPRYYRNVVNTFYRIRGWGVPMVLSMGKTTWDKTLPYIQGIHDWSGFLLSIKPEASLDRIPDPPELQAPIDNSKIVEVDYQIVEGK